jgi:CRP-like cAMP-binding protein
VILASLALGSLAVPLAVRAVGSRTTLVAVGALLPVLALATRRSLLHIDQGALVPDEQLAAIRSVAFLSILPLQRQEALAAALQRVELDAEATLFNRGDVGDRFYILTTGELEIDLSAGPKRETAPAFVGEIALLRDVPRTATVKAAEPSELWALEREPFLDAILGNARCYAGAHEVLASRAA